MLTTICYKVRQKLILQNQSEMFSTIENIARVAQQTFSKQVNEESMTKLRSLMSKLSANDVNLRSDMIQRGCRLNAPVVHIHLHESHTHSIGIFAIREGKKIPLHNHPDMFGLVKVILGRVKVKSYTHLPADETYSVPQEVLSRISRKQIPNLVPTIADEEHIVSCDDETTCLLTPDNNNIHEIASVDDLSAFLDVLAPPYGGDRKCHYYSVLDTRFDPQHKLNITWLIKIDPPESYWCESLPYTGPKI